MGIHRQGWLSQGEKQHTASCLASHPGQTHQVGFGFGHSPGFEKVQTDTTLFSFDLFEYLFDSGGLDLAQSAAPNGLSDAFCGSRRYSLPVIEAGLERGKSSSRIDVRGILGQYGLYEHVNRVSVRLPAASAVFLFQELDDFFDSHWLKNIMSGPLDAKTACFFVIARSIPTKQSWWCCWGRLPRTFQVLATTRSESVMNQATAETWSICGDLGEWDKINTSKKEDEHDPCREDIS